jgi:putative ABC transport system permease protein
MIPLKYNVRNLRVRWATTILTIFATGFVVWSSCLLFGFIDGLQHSLKVSGDPLDLIVLRNGSTTDVNSGFTASTADEVKNLDGIARTPEGQLLAASEVITIPVVNRRDGTRANLAVRGVEPASRALRPSFKIVEGRDLVPGKGEAIVSTNMARRFAGAGLGEEFRITPKEAYRVVGLFTAGGSSAESEVWVDIGDLRRNTGREGSVSNMQLRANSPADRDKLIQAISNEARFKLAAQKEADYFAKQSASADFLKVAATFIAVLLSIGAMFTSANTMFSAVRSRSREIGTMRAVGFPGRDILISFLFESLLLCSLGGALGLLATLPLLSLTFNTSNFSTFSEVAINFRFGPWVIAGALTMTLVMGLFGGLLPAVRAVRTKVINALREL